MMNVILIPGCEATPGQQPTGETHRGETEEFR